MTVLVVVIAFKQFIYDLTDIMIEEFNLLNPWNSQAVAEDVKSVSFLWCLQLGDHDKIEIDRL